MKSILYTVCSYLPEDKKIIDNLAPAINGMRKWAAYKGIDFKVIDKIPIEIEELFKHMCATNSKVNRMPKRKLHMRKAWSAKLEAFHDFYKNDYDQMLFLDCDMLPKSTSINACEFNYDNYFYVNLKCEFHNSKDHPFNVARKMLQQEGIEKTVIGRVNAQFFYLTKNYEHNISDVFSYKNLFDACMLSRHCIREEIFMTYILSKHDIMQKIKRPIISFKLKDINRPDKVNYVYENDWEKIIN